MIHFLAGLPRSGSTLLGSLLSQHPKLHVTPTNDLVEMVANIRNSWVGYDGFRAQGLEKVKPRIRTALREMMRGFYSSELEEGKLVLDKNRAWPAYIDLLEDALGRKVKILCPVRDLKDIIASFEKLHRKNPLTAPHGQGDQYFVQQTVMGRCQSLMTSNGTVGLAVRRIMDAIDRGYEDRLFFIPYENLVKDPWSMCIQVFAFLGIRPIEVDIDNIQGIDCSRDVDVWGLPLHSLKEKIDSESDWQTILPKEVSQWIDCEYARTQMLAKI